MTILKKSLNILKKLVIAVVAVIGGLIAIVTISLIGITSKKPEPLPAAPEVNREPGDYDKAVRIEFDCDDFESGELCVRVDGSDTVSVDVDDAEDIEIHLYEQGEHTIWAYVAEDGRRVSETFEGTYVICGPYLSGFAATESGEYRAPATVTFSGAEGAGVYYTLDGTDPMVVDGFGAKPEMIGLAAGEEGIKLEVGHTTITARCITDDGVVGPLITAEYDVSREFCAASGAVVQTETMEFVADAVRGVWSYGPTGENGEKEFRQYLDIGVEAMMVHEYETNQCELSGLDQYPNAPIPAWAYEPLTAIEFYLQPTSGAMRRMTYIEHALYEDIETESYPLPQHLGNWLLWNGNAYWRGDDQIGLAEVAAVSDLITEQMALRAEVHSTTDGESHTYILACNADGTNERELFVQEGCAELDAMTNEILLYHVGDQHLVYHFATGEITQNPYVDAGDNLIGYSSTAVYLKVVGTGAISRVEVDYDAF